MAAIMLVLVGAVVTLAVLFSSAAIFKGQTKNQFTNVMSSNVSYAINEVDRLESSTNSMTQQKLGVIRQYVYTMETVNNMSVQLYGESGRFAPAEAFTALYSDISSYETLSQGAKSSTLDVRTMLQEHLRSLQGYIEGKLE